MFEELKIPKKVTGTKIIQAIVDDDLFRKINDKCTRKNVKRSDTIRALLSKWCEEE